MSKKMMKRSLALGALMAFVITGSAMAASVVNEDFKGSGEIVASAANSYAYRVNDGNEYQVVVDEGKTLTIKNIRGTENKSTYGIQVFAGGKLNITGSTVLDVISNSNYTCNPTACSLLNYRIQKYCRSAHVNLR